MKNIIIELFFAFAFILILILLRYMVGFEITVLASIGLIYMNQKN